MTKLTGRSISDKEQRQTKISDCSARERIVDEALKLFLANGFAGTSVIQITEAAGVAKGTLYWYFKSKDQILEEILDRFPREFLEPLFKKVEQCQGDFLTRFKLFYKTVTESAFEMKELLLVSATMLAELMGSNTNAEKKARHMQMRFHRFIKEFLEQGKRDGAISEEIDCDTQAHIIVANFSGMHLQWCVFGDSFNATAYAIAYRESILRGLGVKTIG
jgi:AcrR family transcriptional regulator